jgi:hypothetical protein
MSLSSKVLITISLELLKAVSRDAMDRWELALKFPDTADILSCLRIKL